MSSTVQIGGLNRSFKGFLKLFEGFWIFIIDKSAYSRLYRIRCHFRDNKQYLSRTITITCLYSNLNDLEKTLDIIRTMYNKHSLKVT